MLRLEVQFNRNSKFRVQLKGQRFCWVVIMMMMMTTTMMLAMTITRRTQDMMGGSF